MVLTAEGKANPDVEESIRQHAAHRLAAFKVGPPWTDNFCLSFALQQQPLQRACVAACLVVEGVVMLPVRFVLQGQPMVTNWRLQELAS